MFFIAFYNPLSLFRPFLAINRLAGKRNEWSREGRAWFAASIDSLCSAM